MAKTPLVRAAILGMVVMVSAPGMGGGETASAQRKKVSGANHSSRASAFHRGRPAHGAQHGKASWYGERFQGRLTASGEQFDMFQMTAAHRSLPMGSRVRVSRVRSKRSVVVRINDRGPVHPGTLIDLSYLAARELGMVRSGRALVRLDIVKVPAGRVEVAEVLPSPVEPAGSRQ